MDKPRAKRVSSASVADRICIRCGRSYSIGRSRPAVFLVRQFCSRECYDLSRAEAFRLDSRKHGRGVAERRFADQPCEVCGATERPEYRPPMSRIQRHHRDGNQANNDPSNIAFLCKPDHTEAHRIMRAQGIGRRVGGHRPRVNALHRERALERFAEAQRLRAEGLTDPQIATRMGVDDWTVSRWFHKYGQT